jgi:hypothetical protein
MIAFGVVGFSVVTGARAGYLPPTATTVSMFLLVISMGIVGITDRFRPCERCDAYGAGSFFSGSSRRPCPKCGHLPGNKAE